METKIPLYTRRLFPSSKPYHMNKSREEGERELERLADSEKYEGSWIFLPATSQWVNFCSNIFERQADLPTTKISNLGNDLTHYHTHQTKGRSKKEQKEKLTRCYLDVLRNNPDRTALQKVQDAESLEKEVSATGHALPSSQDIKAYITLTKENPKCKLDFKIASSRGTITVKIDENLDLDKLSPDKVCNDYADLTVKSLEKICKLDSIPNSRLYTIIENVNKAMKGIFQLSMKYRQSEPNSHGD